MGAVENADIVVMGVGTIGDPLIDLLTSNMEMLGINSVVFSKKSPRKEDRPTVQALTRQGASFAVPANMMDEFSHAGMTPKMNLEEALAKAAVIIDCTNVGSQNKATLYPKSAPNVIGILAQGSATNFGDPFAYCISKVKVGQKWVWIVSCNTHAVSATLRSIAFDGFKIGFDNLLFGDFMIFRRANDISQVSRFIPSPEAGMHDDPIFGSHQAADAAALFKYAYGVDLPLFSSVAKANSQYMHLTRFTLTLKEEDLTREEVIRRLAADPLIALTKKNSSGLVYSFARSKGHNGRLLNQLVVCEDTIMVHQNRVVGFSLTPQDGNSLLSSTAATLALIDPKGWEEKMGQLIVPPFAFSEV